MESPAFKCPHHAAEDVSFFCTVSQWHFVPLCGSCIPPHTQNHPKNFKVSIESFHKVKQKSQSQNKAAIQQYKKRLQKIKDYLASQKQSQVYETLQSARTKIIDVINAYFAKTKKLLDDRIAETIQFQKQLLAKLSTNVEADIDDLQNFQSIKQVQAWSDVVKRLYFKDGITPYLEEIDEVLKDHEDRIFKRKDLAQIQFVKLEEQIKKSLSNFVFISKQNVVKAQQNKMKPKEDKDPKKPKIVIKPKICKSCNGELQYLTSLKKHLYCPNCGGKQRNYTSKKP